MWISSAVHWWEESQLRFLVLSSLAVQWILFLVGPLRKLAIPSGLRFLIWIAYLGGDALAIYSLATLFNRHKGQDGSFPRGRSGSLLEVVWAPILLLHLGGQNNITAYDMEDNDLWMRHLVTAVSQITVAIFVFCNSLPAGGDYWLFQVSLPLFGVGITKCLRRPLILHLSSVNGLSSRPATPTGEVPHKEDHSMKSFSSMLRICWHRLVPHKEDHSVKGNQTPTEEVDQIHSLEKYVQEAKEIIDRHDCQSRTPGVEQPKTRTLVLDFLSPYKVRLQRLQAMCMLDVTKVCGTLRIGLSSTFDSLYTIEDNPSFPLGYKPEFSLKNMRSLRSLNLVLGLLCLLLAIGFFHTSPKEAYIGDDVMVTYTLFCCTALLELFSFVLYILQHHTLLTWPERVAQYGLIGFFVRKHNRSNKFLRLCLQVVLIPLIIGPGHSDSLLHPLYSMESLGASSSRGIIELVLAHLKAGWKEYITDAASYTQFNGLRGKWALERKECQMLSWSLERPYDETVLLWHLATDFCFFKMDHPCTTARCMQEVSGQACATCRAAVRCREISNYMTHLLCRNPEMLMLGARRYLFEDVYGKLEPYMNTAFPCTFNCTKPSPEERVAKTIIDTLRAKPSPEERGVAKTIIDKAWRLGDELSMLGDPSGRDVKKMWEVIEGVWVEMLCFSAGRCRGYLHAKSLGTGGELLTYIWLLLSYMGMETLAERLQREEFPSGTGATPSPSATSSFKVSTRGAAPSTSEVILDGGAAPSTSEIHIEIDKDMD